MSNEAPNLTRTLRLFRDGRCKFIDLCAALDFELSRGMSADQLLDMIDVYVLPREVRLVLEKRLKGAESGRDTESADTTPLQAPESRSTKPPVRERPAELPRLKVVREGRPKPVPTSAAKPVAGVETNEEPAPQAPGTNIPLDERFRDPIGKGSVLDGRFELLECMGKGGIGTVYKATDRKRSKSAPPFVAVKILNLKLRNELRALVAFESEAKIAGNLKHPHIVETRGYVSGDVPYIVMEFLDGESLADKVRRRKPNSLTVARALEIVIAVGQALSFAHRQGIVHCDVKPENVYLTKSGQVKLIDFGVARSSQADSNATFSVQPAHAATRSYASPEILEMRRPDVRDDVYSLASTAYKLITGDPPFGKSSAMDARTVGLRLERPEGLSRGQWEALQRALRLDRDSRTPSIERFIEEINAKRSRGLSVSAAAGVLLLLGAAASYMFFGPMANNGNGLEAHPEVTARAAETTIVEPRREPEPPDGPLRDSNAVGTRDAPPDPAVAERPPVAQPRESTASRPADRSEASQRAAEPVSVNAAASERPDAVVVAPARVRTRSAQPDPEPVKRQSPATTPAEIRFVGHTSDPASDSYDVTVQADIIGSAQYVHLYVESDGAFSPYPMYDDGTGSDPTAYDNIYHAAAPTTDPTQPVRYYVVARTRQGQTLYQPPQAELDPFVIQPAVSANAALRPTVIINEFMADNKQTIYDPQGDYDDWIELFNPTAKDVALDGFYLTNDANKLRRWRFPDGTVIPARGYLIIWADDHSSYSRVSRRTTELHAAFKLDQRGGEILLVDTDERSNAIIDRVEFGRQRQDFSSARVSLADHNFRNISRGSPGRSN